MSKRFFLTFLGVIVLTVWMYGQELEPHSYRHIDRHVRKIPDSLTHNIMNLHNYLVAQANNDVERVRAFYLWIITNIEYKDKIELMFDKNLLFYIGTNNCSTPVCVLKRRIAVCEGFSRLFQYLCVQSEIECYSIGGYITKNGALQDRATHSWNIAKIDGVWFGFDLSWGNAILHHTGVKSKANEFFMVSPREMVRTHLPLIPMWQFLPNPIKLDLFNGDNEQIDTYLSETPDFYNFEDSIAQYNKLSNAERRLKTAEEIKKANPGNKFNLAVEYYRYSRSILHYEGEIDALHFYHLIKARDKLRLAIQLFKSSSDISSKLLLLQSLDDLSIIQKKIDMASSDIIYLR